VEINEERIPVKWWKDQKIPQDNVKGIGFPVLTNRAIGLLVDLNFAPILARVYCTS
jgi:hypothetical protein